MILDHGPAFGLNWGLPFENYKGDLIYLREGDTVRLGEDRFIILFTPGHSPGHISFYCPDQDFVVSGDVLFKRSIGRTDLPMGDFDTLARSIRTQLYTLPDETMVYNGHGEPTTIGEEKKENPFVKG
ncbi:MBL fold metallo-hydrolase [Paraflavitalea speifideaquila]|uniref:MBL fold metallo-hydrolase n=1 Tax=Paraflavitalea speifideaquila TaxID=3076558 RepID=UPI0028EB0EE6|nr:MBL fold metallo-hydrolase [Paraflavitalea speifideiaquila]